MVRGLFILENGDQWPVGQSVAVLYDCAGLPDLFAIASLGSDSDCVECLCGLMIKQGGQYGIRMQLANSIR